MKIKLTGSVHYANGEPFSNVEVRIFDKDTEGKLDDDLTVTPGLSDDRGYFTLTYEPFRYLDYHTLHLPGSAITSDDDLDEQHEWHLPDVMDVYLPYLKFNYTFNGLICEHTISLGLFQSRFFLPENPPVEFLPSVHGFKFTNSFSGYFLPFSTPAFMSPARVSSSYGLCGGMCAAAYDFALAGRSIPDRATAPRQGTRLHRYLYRRQMDSLGGLGQQVLKVAQWTTLPTDTSLGTMRRTVDEISQIQRKLDNKNPVVLALIVEYASSLGKLSKLIFNNHQVLAYAYQFLDEGGYDIQIYDPNLPGRDDVIIHAEKIPIHEEDISFGNQTVSGLKSTQILAGTPYKNIRGFFSMPYTPVLPPKGI